jgi:hypothetical protein
MSGDEGVDAQEFTESILIRIFRWTEAAMPEATQVRWIGGVYARSFS